MKGVKEIKNRIRAVNSTAKITRAMQLVASSKMRKSQELTVASRHYMLLLTKIAEDISKLNHKHLKHPFFEQRQVKSRGIIVIGTDRGLCGALNNNIVKFLKAEIKDFSDVKIIAIGRKMMNALSQFNVVSYFNISDRVEYHEISQIVAFVKKAYLDNTIDSLDVVFAQYINPLVQKPVIYHILPMLDFKNELEHFKKFTGTDYDHLADDPRPMIIEPDIPQVLDIVSQMFLSQNIYRVILEAKASEHSSRMFAMKTATDNAESLAKNLSLEYNKLRQSAITNEIIEISSAKK